MLATDARDFPLSDMSKSVSEEDLLFEKSMIETRATTVSFRLRLVLKMATHDSDENFMVDARNCPLSDMSKL